MNGLDAQTSLAIILGLDDYAGKIGAMLKLLDEIEAQARTDALEMAAQAAEKHGTWVEADSYRAQCEMRLGIARDIRALKDKA